MKIKALQAFAMRNATTGGLTSIAYGDIAEVDSAIGNQLITDGLAEAYTLVSPAGTYDITEDGLYDIAGYANVRVADAYTVDLIERDVENITIPSTVTSLGQSAFNGCASLKSVTIPSSVTSIGQYAFSGCTSLKEIVIPDSVTSIGQYAFSANTSLESADIGAGVSAIPAFMFTGCSKLESITVRATTPPTIGGGAFTNVPNDAVIYVPSDAVDTYKSATGWSDRATYIQAIE